MNDAPSLEEVQAMVARLTPASMTAAAEEITRGVRYLTVVHGDAETDDDARRQSDLSNAAWKLCAGTRLSIRGTNDTRTYRVEPGEPSADAIIDVLADTANRLNPGWWKIRRSAF